MALAACGSEAPDSPTAPPGSGSSRSVVSVTVACTQPQTYAHQCTATARLSDGGTQEITRDGAVWSSSDPNVAHVDAFGYVSHHTPGRVEITARFKSMAGSALLTVSTAPGIAVLGVRCQALTSAHQCEAVAATFAKTSYVVTSGVGWSSTDTAVATVDSSGYVSHHDTGQTEIRATYGDKTGFTRLDIVVSSPAAR